MVRFLHSADHQIGKPFVSLPSDVSAVLQRIRLESIDRMVGAAAEHQAAFIVIAGDFFDSNSLSDDTVVDACARLRTSPVPVFILPGNHDAIGGPDSIYRRASFVDNKPEHVAVLASRDGFRVDGCDVVLVAAPLLVRKHTTDPTVHFDSLNLDSSCIRIGVAHGRVEGADQYPATANVISAERWKTGHLDYLALGDAHSRWRINDRVWYSGTPEPTALREDEPGHVLIVDIAEPGALPVVEAISVAQTKWIRHDAEIRAIADVNALAGWFEDLDGRANTLVELRLSGELGVSDLSVLDRLLVRMRGELLHLKQRGAVEVVATVEDLAAVEVDGYVRRALEQLLESDRPDRAQALRILHRLYRQEVREC